MSGNDTPTGDLKGGGGKGKGKGATKSADKGAKKKK